MQEALGIRSKGGHNRNHLLLKIEYYSKTIFPFTLSQHEQVCHESLNGQTLVNWINPEQSFQL